MGMVSMKESLSRVDLSQVEIRTDRREDAFEVRRRVFMDEQGYADEFDAIDDSASCVHITLYLDGEIAGCARVFAAGSAAEAESSVSCGGAGESQPGLGRQCVDTWLVGRVAVLPQFRGRGFGACIMQATEREARVRGARRLRLHSQEHAVGFYECCGYTRASEVDYEDEGQPHLWMEKKLRD